MEEVFAEFDSDDDFDRCAITLADESTQIYGDCERFDDSESVAEYHVAKTGVITDADAAGYLYFYYDKDAAHNTTYVSMSGYTAAQSVYDANFKAVYHMNDPETFAEWSARFDAWTEQYEADVEPDSDGWSLTGTDYASSDGDILTIDTSDNDAYTCYYSKTPDVDFNAGFYLKTRVKASTDMDDTNDGLIVQIDDGTQNERFRMYIRNGVVRYFYVGELPGSFEMDTTTSYVIYEIYIKGSTFWIYADGVQKATSSVYSKEVSDVVYFGDDSAAGFCKASIDYVYYALGVGYNPTLTELIVDSTSNANHGTKKGANEPVEATGKVGQGQDFDGADDHIDRTTENLTPQTGTFEMLFNTDNVDAAGRMFSELGGGGYFNFMLTGVDDNFKMRVHDGTAFAEYEEPVSISTWYHAVATFDTSEAKFYIDGAWKSTDSSFDGLFTDGTGIKFGDSRTNLVPYDGKLDEARISDVVRNAAWNKATYNSLYDTLLTYGDEETPAGIVWNGVTITKWNGITITKINGK